MGKAPASQWYWADWRKDPGVQALSYHDRGVWFEILGLMHESEQPGKLLLNGKKMPDDALARILGLDNQSLNQTLTTLLTYGVASLDHETGALVNRRMVRDEEIRKIRSECGKMGGNPRLLKQNPNQTPTTGVNQSSKLEPTPSSSSSSSSSSSINKKEKIMCGEFQNVKLSGEEREKLVAQFGEAGCRERVENLSQYIASKGKKYSSHYATILSWERKNGGSIKKPEQVKRVEESVPSWIGDAIKEGWK